MGKKIPLRQCVGCGEMKSKKEMLQRDAKLTLVSSVSIVEGGAHDVTLRSTSTGK